MALLLMVQEDAGRRLRRERIFRDRQNPFEQDDIDIIRKYRLGRREIMELCDLLGEDLVRHTKRSGALSVTTQVFAALRYGATGNFQQVTGDILGISQPSVSRAVHAFC